MIFRQFSGVFGANVARVFEPEMGTGLNGKCWRVITEGMSAHGQGIPVGGPVCSE